jgi:hypothetical protein
MKVLTTTKYDLFKTIKGNRPLDPSHVQRLATSIEEENLLEYRPILVNADMEVIDGQNRLAAAKMLGIPIPYVVLDGGDYQEVARLNAHQKSWNLANYLEMYAAQGYPDYIKLEEFSKRNRLNPCLCILLCFDNNHRGTFLHDFKNGKFKYLIQDEVAEHYLRKLREINEFLLKKTINHLKLNKFINSKTYFVGTMSFLSNYYDEIDWGIFYEHLELKLGAIVQKGTPDEYEEMFREVYNWHMKNHQLEPRQPQPKKK